MTAALLRSGAGEVLGLGFIHAPLLGPFNAMCQVDGGCVCVIHACAQRRNSDKLVYRNQRAFVEAGV